MRKHIFYLLPFLSISLTIFTNQEISYSLITSKGEPLDQLLYSIMNINNGIFIEVGAHDGITQSNTKLLEEFYGWTGVLIEPSACLFDQLCKNRPNSWCFQCALGSFNENNTCGYGDFNGCLMASFTNRVSTSDPTEMVLIRSLQSILDTLNINHINFFSLDTEGYELNILNGIDFSKTSFDYILIEIYTHQHDAIISLLENNGYELIGCISNYNKQDNPDWDGTHNDYLFKKM